MTIASPRAGLRHDGLVLRLPTDDDLPIALRAFGDDESERVLERAGFTRERVLRSLPRNRGGRGDSPLFFLLAGE